VTELGRETGGLRAEGVMARRAGPAGAGQVPGARAGRPSERGGTPSQRGGTPSERARTPGERATTQGARATRATTQGARATRATTPGGRDGTPSGRRPGANRTREAILTAARETFAEHGYGGTTIRGIATAAGVDPALVHHFYGSKDELFATVLQLPEEVTAHVRLLLEGGLDGAGERLTRFYLGLWEAPETQPALLTTVRSAVAHEGAARLLRDVISARLLGRIGHLLPDHAELRVSLAMSHLGGLAIGRYVFRVPPVDRLDIDELVSWVAPTIQRYLAGPPPGLRASD
jgi:AcrR family transcriptional regulator